MGRVNGPGSNDARGGINEFSMCCDRRSGISAATDDARLGRCGDVEASDAPEIDNWQPSSNQRWNV
jgi:hypothetical protein